MGPQGRGAGGPPRTTSYSIRPTPSAPYCCATFAPNAHPAPHPTGRCRRTPRADRPTARRRLRPIMVVLREEPVFRCVTTLGDLKLVSCTLLTMLFYFSSPMYDRTFEVPREFGPSKEIPTSSSCQSRSNQYKRNHNNHQHHHRPRTETWLIDNANAPIIIIPPNHETKPKRWKTLPMLNPPFVIEPLPSWLCMARSNTVRV